MIEQLEPRQMLATFNGTSGADSIRVWMSGATVNVQINTTQGSTTDSTIIINAIGGNDQVSLDDVPTGLTVNLGNLGVNRVLYCSDNNILDASMPQATINGGTGFDSVTFNDYGRTGSGFTYDTTATTAMNQLLNGIENISFETLTANSAATTSGIYLRGFPGGRIQVNRGGAFLNTYIGTPADPINLASEGKELWSQNVGKVYIYADDPNNTRVPIRAVTDTVNSPRQLVTSGGFNGRFWEENSIEINSGATSDIFQIGGVLHGTRMTINAGGGDDSLTTDNSGGHLFNLDAIFPYQTGVPQAPGAFRFNGQDGTDSIDLNDTNDQTADGDANYFVGGAWLGKGANQGYNGNALVAYSAERVTVTGDGDGNVFTFATYEDQQTTIDGGAGNDVFTNYSFEGVQGTRGVTTLIGNTGNDGAFLYDTDPSAQALTEYDFGSAGLSYKIFSTVWGAINYDATLEELDLEQNEASTITRINSKPGSMLLKIHANGGNDSFFVGGGDIDNNGFSLSNMFVNGDGGFDTIRLDDSLDDRLDNTLESETYLHTASGGFNKLGKSTAGVNYGTFEAMTLDTANRATGSFLWDNTLNFNSFDPAIASITINGGNVRSNIVSLTTGAIPTASAFSATLNLPADGDELLMNDLSSTSNNTYTVRPNALSRNPGGSQNTVVINHTGVETLRLSAGGGGDFISVEAIPAGTSFEAHGNGGDDRLNVEDGGAWDALDGPSFLYGDAGNDLAVLIANNTAAANATLTNTGMSVNGGPVQSYFSAESVTASFGAGSTNLNITSMAWPCQVNLGNSNDHVTIGGGSFQENITRTINVGFGVSSGDSVTFDDSLDTGNDVYQFNPAGAFFKQSTAGVSAQVNAGFFNGGTTTLLANDGNNIIVCNANSADLRIFARGGNDTVNTWNGNVTIDTGMETGTNPAVGDVVEVNWDYTNVSDLPAAAKFAAADRLSNLLVRNRGTLQIPTGVTLDINSLVLQGVIDFNGGAMMIRNGAPAMSTIKNIIKTGRNNGAWNGASTGAGSINSSLAASTSKADAVGYARSNDLFNQFPATFAGVAVDANALLIRYAICGDADLNGVIDFDDYSRVDNGFNTAGGEWFRGDFDYNGRVDFDDYALIDLAFNTQSGVRAGTARTTHPSRVRYIIEF